MDKASDDFQLTFGERGSYLYARITAEAITNEIAEGYVRAIGDRCRETKARQLMIDRQVAVAMTNTKAYLVVCMFEEMLSMPVSIAFVDADALNRSRFEFAIRAASPSDLTIKIFATPSEAEQWLAAIH